MGKRFLSWSGPNDGDATDYAHVGKDGRQMDAELRETSAETRQRTNNGLDTEDQDWRTKNLHEARGRLN
ncbi:hypothetical protein BJF78_32705 [Pseudonocardia sp. CNS-139]|nr:hypothetical protein BJF78_32705 [Pseudonocardia sp. CNS-139]